MMMFARALAKQQHRIPKRCFSSSSSSSASSSSSSSPLVQWHVEPVEYYGSSSSERSVGILTIGAPDTFNALTVEMGHAFAQACRNPPDHINAVIVTGAGVKAFSAGGNVDWLKSLHDHPVHVNVDLMLDFYHNFLTLRDLPVPVIAAMCGPAVGAGAGLALACDMRIAARSTPKLLTLNFTTLGIHPGMGAVHFLQQAVASSGVVNEILMLGKTLSAVECHDLKLVNALVDQPSHVLPAALALVRNLVTTQHPVAIQTLVRTLRSHQNVGLEQALQRDAYAQAVCYARTDWGEGVQAVMEKRAAIFDVYAAK